MKGKRIIPAMVAVLSVVSGVAMGSEENSTAVAAHNRAAARRDVAAHLAALTLPAGAIRVRAEPKRDHAYLKPLEALEGDGANEVGHRWWVLSGSSQATVIAFVEAHSPMGSHLSGTGTGSNLYTGTSDQSVYFQWPAVGQTIAGGELAITATALPGGKTGVLAEAQSDWIVPRPSAEVVPSGVHEIDVTGGVPDAEPTVSLTVTNARQVGRIVSVIDGLDPLQPIQYGCPVELDPHQITLTFRGVSGGPALAHIDYTVFGPHLLPAGGACNSSLQFTIRGRTQAPLAGGPLVSRLQSILGTSLV